MASQYTVVEVHGSKPKPDRGYGAMQEISLSLTNGDGEPPQRVTWYTKATTQPPAPGSQLFGDVSEGQYGLQFKKAQNPMGGAPGRFEKQPTHPKDAARMGVAHSDEMALTALAVMERLKVLTPEQVSSTREFFELVDKTSAWFKRRVDEAGEKVQ